MKRVIDVWNSMPTGLQVMFAIVAIAFLMLAMAAVIRILVSAYYNVLINETILSETDDYYRMKISHPLKVIIDEGAWMPERAHKLDAGLDLRIPFGREGDAKYPYTIFPHNHLTFDTGIHIQIPEGYFGIIESKSGLNVGANIVSCGGTIDAGYTGSIKVKLYNLGDDNYTFYPGEKIAQLIILPCELMDLEQVDSFPETERGNNGFGSTGR